MSRLRKFVITIKVSYDSDDEPLTGAFMHNWLYENVHLAILRGMLIDNAPRDGTYIRDSDVDVKEIP